MARALCLSSLAERGCGHESLEQDCKHFKCFVCLGIQSSKKCWVTLYFAGALHWAFSQSVQRTRFEEVIVNLHGGRRSATFWVSASGKRNLGWPGTWKGCSFMVLNAAFWGFFSGDDNPRPLAVTGQQAWGGHLQERPGDPGQIQPADRRRSPPVSKTANPRAGECRLVTWPRGFKTKPSVVFHETWTKKTDFTVFIHNPWRFLFTFSRLSRRNNHHGFFHGFFYFRRLICMLNALNFPMKTFLPFLRRTKEGCCCTTIWIPHRREKRHLQNHKTDHQNFLFAVKIHSVQRKLLPFEQNFSNDIGLPVSRNTSYLSVLLVR